MNEDPLDIARTIGRDSKNAGGYTLSAGDTLGQYRIIRVLGRGGMGEVYEAENTITRKKYALKVLPREATGGTFVDRFRVEARVMQDLRHAHIVQVHHAGEEGGLYYLTMDLVTGRGGEPESLEDLCSSAGLARRSLGGGGSSGGSAVVPPVLRRKEWAGKLRRQSAGATERRSYSGRFGRDGSDGGSFRVLL